MYKEYINDYICDNYLDPENSHKLEGWAAVPQVQVGNTNGAKNRCVICHSRCRQLLSNNKQDKQSNVIRMSEAERRLFA